MNDKLFEDEMMNELSPEESAAIDRIMMSVAGEEDAEVDYDGMLRRIKKAAAAEGISVFPSAKSREKKRGRREGRKGASDLVRTLLIGAGTAAAVFAVGFALLSVLGKYGMKSEAPSAHVDDMRNEQAASPAESIASSTGIISEDKNTPIASFASSTEQPTNAPEITPEPTQEYVITEMPVITADPGFNEIIPTSYPTKGGTAGVADLTAFVTDPAILEQLIPALPEYMQAKAVPEENAVYANGYDYETGRDRSYTCRMIEDADAELPIGYARFADNEEGLVHYIWRVTELTYLDIELSGFTRAEAEELLATLPLCSGSDPGEFRDAA